MLFDDNLFCYARIFNNLVFNNVNLVSFFKDWKIVQKFFFINNDSLISFFLRNIFAIKKSVSETIKKKRKMSFV